MTGNEIAACIAAVGWKELLAVIVAVFGPILGYIGKLHADIAGLNKTIQDEAQKSRDDAIRDRDSWAEHARIIAAIRSGQAQ